jgi:hypothetical protein
MGNQKNGNKAREMLRSKYTYMYRAILFVEKVGWQETYWADSVSMQNKQHYWSY